MKQRGKLECSSPGSGAADVGDAGDVPRLSQCSISCHSMGSKGLFSPRDVCLLFCQMPREFIRNYLLNIYNAAREEGWAIFHVLKKKGE